LSLQQAKQIIRGRIKAWSDEKLAAIYCFNVDGNMSFFNCCGCLVGVDTSEVPHEACSGPSPFEVRPDLAITPTFNAPHYYRAMRYEAYAPILEEAYLILGGSQDGLTEARSAPDVKAFHAGLRQRRLSAILRAEMRIRDRAVSFISADDLAAIETLCVYEEAAC
jgi:hypothetical protein